MRRFFIILGMLALILSLSLVNVSAKEVTIQFWHAMGGHNMEVVNSLVDQFNKTHPGIKVEAQMAGTYDDVLSKTQAAVRTKTAHYPAGRGSRQKSGQGHQFRLEQMDQAGGQLLPDERQAEFDAVQLFHAVALLQ